MEIDEIDTGTHNEIATTRTCCENTPVSTLCSVCDPKNVRDRAFATRDLKAFISAESHLWS